MIATHEPRCLKWWNPERRCIEQRELVVSRALKISAQAPEYIMQVAKDTVVTLHYTLHADDGLKIESSRDGGEPVHILIGHGGIIPGLEKALVGHDVGEQFSVDVEPKEAYGDREEGNVQRVPKKYFKDSKSLRPGVLATLSMKDGGQRSVTILKVGSSVVDVDLNHPLAGRKLRFDVETIAVREATAEEIAHRHVHGTGGVVHS